MPDEPAYQWWQIACGALNFVAAALATRWFGCGHLLAALGGFLWAFALVHIDQTKHQQMIPRFWMPFAVYYAWQLALAPSLKSLNRTLACVFLQSAACVYTGWFLVVGLAVFVPVSVYALEAWGGVKRFVKENRRRVPRVAALWGVLLVGFFAPYMVVNRDVSREYKECVELIPRLDSWLTGPPGSRWHEALKPRLSPVFSDCQLFCGFALCGLMLASALHTLSAPRPRSAEQRLVAACLVTAGVWFALTLGFGPPDDATSLWWGVRFLPGGLAVRAVCRVYVVVYLFGGLAALVWLHTLVSRIRAEWVRVAVVLAVATPVVYEQTGFAQYSFERAAYYPEADRLAAELRGAEVAYVVPRPRPVPGGEAYIYGDVLAMWAGLRANVPVVNGYSGRYPPKFPVIPTDVDGGLRAWLTGKFRGTVTVIDPHRPGEVRRVVIE
jgi:hypothetical protein